jgi:hypothetical protein
MTVAPCPLWRQASSRCEAWQPSKQLPVVIGSEAHDVYAQVAENQKRPGLTPLDLAKFMRSRVDCSANPTPEIAKQMGIDSDIGATPSGAADLAPRT